MLSALDIVVYEQGERERGRWLPRKKHSSDTNRIVTTPYSALTPTLAPLVTISMLSKTSVSSCSIKSSSFLTMKIRENQEGFFSKDMTSLKTDISSTLYFVSYKARSKKLGHIPTLFHRGGAIWYGAPCFNASDCNAPFMTCNKGNCVCDTGYAYNATNDTSTSKMSIYWAIVNKLK